jgi:DNA-binding Lrp family transcriptional regulator
MATGNFHNVNASRIFAVQIEEEWDYEDLKSNLLCELEAKGFVKGYGNDPNELRSFPSSILASKSVYKDFCGVEVEVEITAIVRSGYYSGVNLDWQLDFKLGNGYVMDEIPEQSEIAEDLDYYGDTNKGMATIQAKNVEKFFEKTRDILIEELETIYQENSIALVTVARFSNGETIYGRADDKRSMLKSIVNGYVNR